MFKKQSKAEYDKAYRAANKEIIAEKMKAYYKANRDEWLADIKVKGKVRRESEGYGVYKAVYPSGVYIGSGQIYSRRLNHLSGNCGIARKLNEKAVSFDIVCLCSTKQISFEQEQKVINWYGLDDLLNTKNVQQENV